eukprot:Lankesteria_metandrocarpae@DN441_c0_g1_i1.p3
MPMGVRNGPATFCRWLGRRLHDCVPSHCLRVYQDDIFIAGGSTAEHSMNLSQVERVLRQHALAINPRKTQFSETGLNVLGVELRNGEFRLGNAALTSTIAHIESLLSAAMVTRRELYKVVGKVNFFRTLGHDVHATLAPVYAHTRLLTTWTDKAPLPDSVR